MIKIPVGVSQCLLGAPVRYDGGHKHDRYLTEVLGQYLDFQPVCPEVAIGLGTPRKPIRLVATDAGTRVRGLDDPSLDVTTALTAEADAVVARMPHICGYVFMQKSPSCGAFAMKRYAENGNPLDNKGRGAFAQRLMELMPLLPVEESGRLNDAALRDNFITRVFALHDWRQSVEAAPSAKALLDFYSRYKYQVMAHQVSSYEAIGRLLADLSSQPIDSICEQFLTLFLNALQQPASRKGNINTMLHLRGYFGNELTAAENRELDDIIGAYRRGEVALVVPLTLLKHHLLKVDDPYLEQQTFWSPHPAELGLRNNIISQG